MRLLLLFLPVLLVLPRAALAQPPPAERLFYGWLDGQREAFGPDPFVLTFTERAERRLDGFRGSRTIETETAMAWDGRELRRRVLRARVDDHEVEPEALAHLDRRLEEAHGRELHLLRRVPILSARFFARFAPTGETETVVRDGRTLWRVDALVDAPDREDEGRARETRARLYFDASQPGRPRLVVAEAEIAPPPRARRTRRGPPPDVQIAVEAAFERTSSGLDLASRQRVESVVRQRRRLRHVSIAAHADLRFSDYQLRPRP